MDFDVFLVPLDDGAVGHAGVLHRHQRGDGAAGDDKAAHVLRQVAGKAENLLHQRVEQFRLPAVAGHTLLLEAFGEIRRAIPPGHRLGQVVHEHRVQPQRLAHVAHRAARAVGDHRGGQCGAFARVLVVDVLDDFLAPLVLEVHVDVRRLVALAGNETLEQQRDLLRRHLGDEQAVAHHRVGRRAAALAQDVARAREAHDVVHGEEVVLVVQLLDQRQLRVDALLYFSAGTPRGQRTAEPCATSSRR